MTRCSSLELPASALGVAAGFYGGFIDTVIMRYIDLQWAFPNFIIAVYLSWRCSGPGCPT